MTKLKILPILLVGLLFAPAARALAHPGHEHKIMGTVSVVHQNHLEVKAIDGKTSLFTMNEKTRVFRGNAKVNADSIKVAERVVVTAIETKDKDGKVLMIANEIRLAAAVPPSQRTDIRNARKYWSDDQEVIARAANRTENTGERIV